MRRLKNTLHGFTLVELLVVFAIIAVVLSLFIPAIIASRRAHPVTYDRSQPVNLGVESLQDRLIRIETKLDKVLVNQKRNR